MKKFLTKAGPVLMTLLAAFVLVEVVAPVAEAANHLLGFDATDLVLGAAGPIVSLAGLKNIQDQMPNPSGARRILVILTADLKDDVIDWPKLGDIGADGVLTTAIPVKTGKTLSIITPADNSADGMWENQGDRYYQSYKHGIVFDIAGNTDVQKAESKKFLNAGCIFLLEQHDGQIDVYGTKLNPIVVKQKGQLGKKGGDKRGRTFTGDNDNYIFEPPIYGSALALPLPVIPAQ